MHSLRDKQIICVGYEAHRHDYKWWWWWFYFSIELAIIFPHSVHDPS